MILAIILPSDFKQIDCSGKNKMNKIGQVAKAIFDNAPEDWLATKEQWNIVAKAAIEAMREPTEAMLKFYTKDNDLFDWNCSCGYCGGHKFAVQSYIDAALKED